MPTTGYPRAPKAAQEQINVRLRTVTLARIYRCKALLHALYRHSTMDAVLAQAAERLERALRDECRKKGIDPDAAIEKRLNPSGKNADGKVPDAVGEDRKPMIME